MEPRFSHTISRLDLNAGMRCTRRAYLNIHRPEVGEPSRLTAEKAQAPDVQACVRECLGPGLVFPPNPHSPTCVEQATRAAVANHTVERIYNGYFVGERLRGSIDVLERDADAWTLTTTTQGTKVDDTHVRDATVQYLLAEDSGLRVDAVYVLYVDPDFVYTGDRVYYDLFNAEAVTEAVRARVPAVRAMVEHFLSFRNSKLPSANMASHCKTPYACEYQTYCENQLSEYPVHLLPRSPAAAQKLRAQGIADIRDIPLDQLKSVHHERVRRVTVFGRPEVVPGARSILESLPYPRHYVDFETVKLVVPVWPGVKPHQQIPFQWSCHTEHRDRPLAHNEFLDLSGSDPRRVFAEQLIGVCGHAGPVIVYNAAFERRILRELTGAYSDLAPALEAIERRLFDLLPVVQHHYYHPKQRGSWSLKAVVPYLAPELSYTGLDGVQDGESAQLAYLNAVDSKTTAIERDALRRQLSAYCELDTLAMVVIRANLCALDVPNAHEQGSMALAASTTV